jgi:CO/xanthine dehydrogenase Mo-binding subunit
MVAYLKIGAQKDGTITAIHLDPCICDVGDSGVEGEGFLWAIAIGARPADMLCEDLTCPNILSDNRVALTSKTGAGSFRCEKNQTAFTLGKITQLVSERLRMDPVQIALKNANVSTNSLSEVIKAGKEAIGWDEKWHLPGTRILENGRMHGMGFAWSHMWHAGGSIAASLAASMDVDGSVTLISSMADVGVSAHTTYIMVAAEELGVTTDKVHFALNDSDCTYALKTPGGS